MAEQRDCDELDLIAKGSQFFLPAPPLERDGILEPSVMTLPVSAKLTFDEASDRVPGRWRTSFLLHNDNCCRDGLAERGSEDGP